MKKFLVTDDSTVARNITKKIIENSGHKVVAEAESGEKAILQYRIFTPDVVTLDYNMPGIGGFEAAKAILKLNASAKIIFITAHDIIDTINELESCSVITKPLTKEKLTHEIENLYPTEPETSRSASPTITTNAKNLDVDTVASQSPNATQSDAVIINDLGIQPGHIVALTHFSGEKFYITSIMKYDNNIFTIKITKEFDSITLTEPDPIALVFKSKEESCLCECFISNINYKNKTFEATLINKIALSTYQVTDRLPVSLYIEIRDPNSNGKTKNSAHVKNINQECMSIFTHLAYAIGDNFMFDMFIGTNIVSLGGKVTSMVNHNTYFEYDLDIAYHDYSKKSYVRMFIERSKKDQEDTIKRLGSIE